MSSVYRVVNSLDTPPQYIDYPLERCFFFSLKPHFRLSHMSELLLHSKPACGTYYMQTLAL